MLAVGCIGEFLIVVTLGISILVGVEIQPKKIMELGLMPPQIVKEFLFFRFCHTNTLRHKPPFVKLFLQLNESFRKLLIINHLRGRGAISP